MRDTCKLSNRLGHLRGQLSQDKYSVQQGRRIRGGLSITHISFGKTLKTPRMVQGFLPGSMYGLLIFYHSLASLGRVIPRIYN